MPSEITIVGLGPGDPKLLTREAWEVLVEAQEIYLRTNQHPVVSSLPAGLRLRSFDDLYQDGEDFASVYEAIVGQVLELADRPGGVVYAVPGDPSVGETTVQMLRERAVATGIDIRIVHGVSFVEPCLAAIGIDVLDGLTVTDALLVAGGHHPQFPPDVPALMGQLYSQAVAADVKLTLMNQYPDEHVVHLIHAAGTEAQHVETMPLLEIDRSDLIAGLTSLFVPPLSSPSSFESFQETVAHLRAPEGCPWDRKQTHQTLRQHMLEEAYEVLHALDRGDLQDLSEELGDLLLQIVLQAQIATEAGDFSMGDVIATINHKIIRRHPHVFGDLDVEGVDEVLHNWEALKAEERDTDGEGKGVLDGVPGALPALAQADELQARVARVGFDWPEISGVIDKIQEELSEVQAARDSQSRNAEVGDLLFAVVNYARWLGVDPEASLREASGRFRERFARVEAEASRRGLKLHELGIQDLDALWEWAKQNED